MTEKLVDPDCVAGKHTSCVGGPCECPCGHGQSVQTDDATRPDLVTERLESIQDRLNDIMQAVDKADVRPLLAFARDVLAIPRLPSRPDLTTAQYRYIDGHDAALNDIRDAAARHLGGTSHE